MHILSWGSMLHYVVLLKMLHYVVLIKMLQTAASQQLIHRHDNLLQLCGIYWLVQLGFTYVSMILLIVDDILLYIKPTVDWGDARDALS